MDRLHVGTLNIRSLMDRWDERLPLLLAGMAALQPDVLALVAALVGWLSDVDGAAAVVVTGDFNAPPHEPAYRRMVEAGFRSAHAEANVGEPKATWPSGIVAEGMDTEGAPACLDYIWLRGAASAVSCRLVFDRPAVDDPTLYPSDHVGLSAVVRVGPGPAG